MTPLARRIRRCVLIATVFGVAAGIFGMLPGKRYYARNPACVDTLAMTEHHGGSLCPFPDEISGERPQGGGALLLYLAVVLGFGALLYREPSRVLALAWTGFALVTGFVLLILTFRLGDAWGRSEPLWPAHAMQLSFGVTMLMIFPVAFVIGIVGDRGRRTDEPTARVVS